MNLDLKFNTFILRTFYNVNFMNLLTLETRPFTNYQHILQMSSEKKPLQNLMKPIHNIGILIIMT